MSIDVATGSVKLGGTSVTYDAAAAAQRAAANAAKDVEVKTNEAATSDTGGGTDYFAGVSAAAAADTADVTSATQQQQQEKPKSAENPQQYQRQNTPAQQAIADAHDKGVARAQAIGNLKPNADVREHIEKHGMEGIDPYTGALQDVEEGPFLDWQDRQERAQFPQGYEDLRIAGEERKQDMRRTNQSKKKGYPEREVEVRDPRTGTVTTKTELGNLPDFEDSKQNDRSEHAIPNRRFKPNENLVYDRSGEALADKHDENGNPRGNTLNDKLVAIPYLSRSLSIADVSIGTNDFIYMVRQPGCPILGRINEMAKRYNEELQRQADQGHLKFTPLRDDWVAEEFTNPDTQRDSLAEMRQFLDRYKVKVGVVKCPISEAESAQWRYLKLHDGDGIAVHPLVAKQFNADFDGDGAGVQFDLTATRFTHGPGDWIRGTNGHPTMDWDFWVNFQTLPNFDAETLSQVLRISKEDAEAMCEAVARGTTRTAEGRKTAMDDLVNILEKYSPGTRVYILDQVIKMATDYKLHEEWGEVPQGEQYDPNEQYGPFLPQFTDNNQELLEGQAGSLASYKEASHRQAEDISGKSVAFRDLGMYKVAKMSQHVTFGDPAAMQTRMKNGQTLMALRAADKVFTGEREEAVLSVMRRDILRKVGLPRTGESFESWWYRFYPEYNIYITHKKLGASRLKHIDGSYVSSESTKFTYLTANKNNAGNMAKAIVDIYGNFKLSSVFGNWVSFADSYIPGNTKDKGQQKAVHSIELFKGEDGWHHIHANRRYQQMTLTELSYDTSLMLKQTADTEQVFTRPVSDPRREELENVMAILSGVSQMQQAKANKLHDQAKKAMKEIKKGQEKLYFNGDVRRADMEKGAAMIAQLDPKTFTYFDADSPGGFLESPWANSFVDCFQGYDDSKHPTQDWMGVLISMKATRVLGPLDAKLRAFNQMDATNVEARDAKWFEIVDEMQRLAAQSPLMRLLMYEATHDNAVFKATSEMGAKYTDGRLKGLDTWVGMYGFSKPYTSSLLELICDPKVPAKVKETFAIDALRYYTGNKYLAPESLLFELEFDDNAAYKDPSKDFYRVVEKRGASAIGQGSVKGINRRIGNKTKRYEKNAFGQYDEVEVELWHDTWNGEDPLDYIAQGLCPPQWNPTVPPSLFNWAVIQSLDPSYASSEKAQNEDAVKMLGDAMKYAYHGGMSSDLFYLDEDGAKTYNWRDLNKHILAKHWKAAQSRFVDSDTGVEDGVFYVVDDFGKKYRVDMKEFKPFDWMTQPSTVSWTEDGSLFVSRRPTDASPNKFQLAQDRAWTALMNDPSFGALVAAHTKEGRVTPAHVMAVTNELLLEILSTPNPSFTEDWINQEVSERWSSWQHLANAVWSNMSEEERKRVKDTATPLGKANTYKFVQTRELFNRAKISSSTAIEGAESSRKGPLFDYLASQEDTFYMSEDGKTLMEYGETDERTVGSAGVPALVMRAMGGEALNLKVAKRGIDDTNSMAKVDKRFDFSLSITGYQHQWANAVQAYKDTGKKSEAAKVMGEYLHDQLIQLQYTYKKQTNLDYDNITLSDCCNLAMASIKETEDGQLYWMTQSQMTNIVLAELGKYSQREIDKMSQDRYRKVCAEAIANASTEVKNVDMYSKYNPWWLDHIKGYSLAPASTSSPVTTGWNKDRVTETFARIADRVPRLKEAMAIGDTSNIPGLPNTDYWWDPEKESLQQAFKNAYGYGLRLMTTETEELAYLANQSDVWKNMLVLDYRYNEETEQVELVASIDFFEYHLNGGESYKSGEWLHVKGDTTGLWEDDENFFGNADASVFAHQPAIDALQVSWKDTYEVSLDDIFEDELMKYESKADIKFRAATKEELDMIVAGHLGIDGDEKMQQRLQEYRNRALSTVEEGKRKVFHPDEIVSFVAMDIYDGDAKPRTMLRPVIPFEIKQGNSKTAPRDFYINGMGFMQNNVSLSWEHAGIQPYQYTKIHEGTDAANKMILYMAPLPGTGYDDHGVPMGMVSSDKTTSGRRMGTNATMGTLVSMFLDCYEEAWAYNFGTDEGAFPNNPGLARRVFEDSVTREEWIELLSKEGGERLVFCEDQELSDWLRMVCKRAIVQNINPSHFLGTKFYKEGVGTGISAYAFDPWVLISPSYSEMDLYLRFMDRVHRDMHFCPSGITVESDGNNYYELATSGDAYTMQKLYTYYNEDGTVHHQKRLNYYRQYMFTNDDYSGFHIPGTDGGKVTPQQVTAAVQSGELVGYDTYTEWSRSRNAQYGGLGKRHSNPLWCAKTTWEDQTEEKDEWKEDVETNILNNEAAKAGIDGITSFRGEYDFLSNMYRCKVPYGGITYNCVETAFQAQKLDLLTWTSIASEAESLAWAQEMGRRYGAPQGEGFLPFMKNMMKNMEPKTAKAIGRDIPLTDAHLKLWNKKRLNLMRKLVASKFESNPVLAKRLAETGNANLVEGNFWNDTYWGVCQGKGKNNLGKVLMETRAKLS